MNITLTNKEQSTTIINGKRYNAGRVIREFCNGIENKAGNQWVDDALEIQVTDCHVVIRDITGDHTILTR